MSSYYKMIECKKLFLLLIVEKDGSRKRWTGIEIYKNDVKDDIWSLNRCSNVRLYAFPLRSSSRKRVEYTGIRENNGKKTVLGKGTQT